MMKQYTKDGKIRAFKVENDRVFATLQIGGVWISNPTLADFLAEGWQEYTPPTPEQPQTPAPSVPTYKELVVSFIRERYDLNDELAILRQRDIKPEEFAEYNAYCEECKEKAKELPREND